MNAAPRLSKKVQKSRKKGLDKRQFHDIIWPFVPRGAFLSIIAVAVNPAENKGEGLAMIMKDVVLGKKTKMERLTLIKERYSRLVLKQRQEIEKEIQDDFREEGEFDTELEPVAEVAAE